MGEADQDYFNYLGYDQDRDTAISAFEENLLKKYIARMRKVCKTEFATKNLFKAINTLAISLFTYSFGLIQWTKTDLENINENDPS